MADPEVVTVARRFKRALLASERGQMLVMAQRWAMTERTLLAHIDALVEEIAAMGTQPTAAQVYRMDRYQSLVMQVREQLRLYEQWAEPRITSAQRAAIEMGRETAVETLAAMGVDMTWNRLPVRAVELMAGLAGDGGPLFGLLQERALWPAAVEGLTDALLKGVSLGWGARKTASRMADGLTGGLDKALTIARTETMRAYRMATVEGYRESNVVSGFRRLAAKDGRTCMACLMSDGETFALASDLTDHPNGRCVAVPILAGEDAPQWQTGREWFEGLPSGRQRAIMGKDKYDAWQRDGWDLGALARTAHSDVWGDAPRVATLEELAQ
jgi:SPP1 gp7 family putative phage head morphogenesis protein